MDLPSLSHAGLSGFLALEAHSSTLTSAPCLSVLGQIKTPLTRAQESRATNASAQTGTEPSVLLPSSTCCEQARLSPQECLGSATSYNCKKGPSWGLPQIQGGWGTGPGAPHFPDSSSSESTLTGICPGPGSVPTFPP